VHTGSGAHVFISHSSKDAAFVRRLVNELQGRNLNVWFDEQNIDVGASIVDRISEGLKESDYVIVVLSQASVSSPWVREELNAALMEQISKKGVVVLPVLMETCEIPALLSNRCYADFRSDFESGLKKLLAVLSQEDESATLETQNRSSAVAPLEPLPAVQLANLRRRIVKCMDRAEVGVIWYDMFERKMEDDMAARPLVECVIELLDRAKKHNILPKLIERLRVERQDVLEA
jgi:hypothetical protein